MTITLIIYNKASLELSKPALASLDFFTKSQWSLLGKNLL